MTGTDTLGARDTDTKLAVLLERSQNTERFISTLGATLNNLGDAVGRIEKTQIQSIERLTAQSENNATEVKRLDALIVHKDQSSLSRDKQQLTIIREGEAERDRLLKEQEQRLKDEIKGNTDQIRLLTVAQQNTERQLAKFASAYSVMVWIASGLGLSIMGLIVMVVTGQVKLVFGG